MDILFITILCHQYAYHIPSAHKLHYVEFIPLLIVTIQIEDGHILALVLCSYCLLAASHA